MSSRAEKREVGQGQEEGKKRRAVEVRIRCFDSIRRKKGKKGGIRIQPEGEK